MVAAMCWTRKIHLFVGVTLAIILISTLDELLVNGEECNSYNKQTYFVCPGAEDDSSMGFCCGSSDSQYCCDANELSSSTMDIVSDDDDDDGDDEDVQGNDVVTIKNSVGSNLVAMNLFDLNGTDYDYPDGNATESNTTYARSLGKSKKRWKPKSSGNKLAKTVIKASVKGISTVVWIIIISVITVVAVTVGVFFVWKYSQGSRSTTRTVVQPEGAPPPSDGVGQPLLPVNNYSTGGGGTPAYPTQPQYPAGGTPAYPTQPQNPTANNSYPTKNPESSENEAPQIGFRP